ncbi:antitoxin [Pectobacterium polaris]|uniref:type II toxin-antitoxin system VapB family antitoxin n=1 Tax=Pectobacterium polaris TaxID=2042057 RepID=UPI000BACE24C|nr:type II toxin-antitoxin system VapB family antitoxin [Pectobacterium polaris]ASY80246.1 antitoxin [Pectobacterium polaris]
MEKTTVFKSNRSQAVRLAKAVELPDDVKHAAIGHTRIITPAGENWDSWFEGNGVTSDFMSTREKPDEQIREDFR